MNRTSTAITVIVLLALTAGGFWYWSTQGAVSPGQNVATSTPTSTAPLSAYGRIVVDDIQPNASIESSITITGKARGWYFEASFPITLYDANGQIIAQVPAQAQSDWMTNDYVPFKATLTFIATTPTGTLVFENDNPSGLPENSQKLEVPVTFPGYATSTMKVKLYYYDQTRDQGPGGPQCTSKGLVAIERTIPKTSTPLAESIRQLLRGAVSTSERSGGVSTDFPLPGVTLKSATIQNGVATITLDDPQGMTDGGACRVSIMRAQIEATAKQFSTVTSVRFLPEGIFQP